MPLKALDVFKKQQLSQLSDKAKLLYIYILTHPNINTLGVVNLNLDTICSDVCIERSELRNYSAELVKAGELKIFKLDESFYFLLTKYYYSLPTGEYTTNRGAKALRELPKEVQNFILELMDIKREEKVFIEPTPEEIEDYGMVMGYGLDGDFIVKYYREQGELHRKRTWCDSRGKPVKDWRRKVRAVWCKPTNKLKYCNEAPKGFEYFYIKKDGQVYYPDGWRNGKPFSKEGIILTEELKSAYEKRSKRNSN